MKHKAIIFDLFGTLVDNFRKHAYDKVYRSMVNALDVPYEAFTNAFGRSFSDRCQGKYDTIEANLEASCAEIGASPSSDRIEAAAKLRYDFTSKTLQPRESVSAALAQLKQDGLQIGLITDCGPDVPLLWSDTPLSSLIDVPVFSCNEKVRKPDPEIYRRALARLGRTAEECVYVGDGGSAELSGARKVGLLPILRRIDLTEIYDARPEVESWEGLAVDEIEELPGLVRSECLKLL